MRVIQLIPRLVVGGAERMVARLAAHLVRRGHAVEVIAMFDPLHTWIEAELREQGIRVHFLGKRPGLDVRMVPRIARVLRGFRPDVVHTHLAVLKYLLPAMALSRRRCRAVHTMHSLADKEAEPPSRLINHVAFRAGVVPVAIGEGVAASIRSTYRLAPARVIPNGIPVSDYVPRPGVREAVRATLGIPADAPVLLSVAMFVEAKNHEGLLAAFASDRLRRAGARLLLAGDGERRALLEQHARSLGCEDRVQFLGVRSDVPRLLAAADAFVLASHYEGNPLSVMEAMASGTPVLATAVGCVPELVTGGSGRLVPAGDRAALEAAMFELLADPKGARVMGAAAAAVARARFDDAAMARAYEQLYLEVT